jgi:predicted outer membrane repeat protein
VHSTLGNSGFILEDSIFEDNSGSYGGSVYFGIDHKDIVLTRNVFLRSSGDYGGALYISEFNAIVSLTSCVWERNTASVYGGAIYTESDDLQMVDCRVLSNSAGSSGAGMYASVDQLNMSSCVFDSNTASESYGGVYMEFVISAFISICNFTSNRAAAGGGMSCSACNSIEIRGCLFNGNAGTESGGALMLWDSCGHIVDTDFTSNLATLSGGGLYFSSACDLIVERCFFAGNIARQGSGASMWISGSLNATVSDNRFVNNTAPNGGGGAVFWVVTSGMGEPQGLENIYLSGNNTALYGDAIATDEYKLVLDSSNTYVVTDYTTSYVPPLAVYVVDFYGQVLLTQSSSVVVASVLSSSAWCYDSVGYVTGGFVLPVSGGVSNFTALSVYCSPGYSMSINMTCTTENAFLSTYLDMSFRSCETGEYYGDNICTMCEHGTYSLTDPSSISLSGLKDVCKECPSGSLDCYGDVIELQKGYWRISNSTTTLLNCPYGDFGCRGGSGSGDELCREGYTGTIMHYSYVVSSINACLCLCLCLCAGPLCAICSDGYAFRSASQRCEACNEDSGFDAITVVIVLVVAVLLVLVGYWYWHPDSSKRVRSLGEVYTSIFTRCGLLSRNSGRSNKDTEKEAKTIARRLRARLKIYTTLWQIISIMPFALDLRFPDAYASIASTLQIFNLDIRRSALVSCSSNNGYDAIDALLVSTIYPIVVMVCLWLAQTIHIWIREKGHVEKDKSANDSSLIKSNYFMAFLVFSYLILPSITVTIFEVFSCQDVDPDDVAGGDDRYMVVDYSVSCSSSKYHFGHVWAIVSIFVYPIGIPAYYLYLLFGARADIMSREDETCGEEEAELRTRRLRPLRLLHDAYKPKLWYWALVDTSRRLMLTGVLVLIAQGTDVQIVVGIVLSLFFLKLYESWKPFTDVTVQSVEIVAQWQVFFVFFIALLLKADFGSLDIATLDVCLVLAVFANILLDLGRLLMGYVCARDVATKEEIAKNCKDLVGGSGDVEDGDHFESGPPDEKMIIEMSRQGFGNSDGNWSKDARSDLSDDDKKAIDHPQARDSDSGDGTSDSEDANEGGGGVRMSCGSGSGGDDINQQQTSYLVSSPLHEEED